MKRMLALFLLTVVLCCSCQPTPETEYIINKGDNTAEEIINAAPPSADPSAGAQVVIHPEFPAHWTDDIRTNYREMVIDADVVVSEMEAYPVYLVESRKFETEESKRLAECFFPEITGYYPHKGSLVLKSEIENAMEHICGEEFTDELREMHMPFLQSLYKNAEDDPEYIPAESVDEINIEPGMFYSIVLPDGSKGGFGIDSSNILSAGTDRLGGLQEKSLVEGEDGGYEGEKNGYVKAEISLEDAVAQAKEFMSRMGLEGFEISFADEVRSISILSFEVYGMGWNIEFMRTHGFKAANIWKHDGSNIKDFGYDENEEYNAPWNEEVIWIYVDDKGVQSFQWNNPVNVISLENEDVQLMDFESISDAIKRTFSAGLGNPDPSVGWFKLNKMTLTVTPQRKKDSPYAYLMPTWVCEIGFYVSNKNELSFFQIPGGERLEDTFTVGFNAIDGTRLNLGG